MWGARGLLALLVLIVIVWVARRTSWYLAIDQFGYLTFASDLAAGRVSHDWPMLPILRTFLPPTFRADVLAYTYIYDQGEIFCRYAPGFPMILAAVSLVFGADATHLVNPVAMGLLLAVLYWTSSRALRSEWLGLAVPLLVTLLPTYVLLWSISPLRDVPAHGLALAGLGLLVPVPGASRSVARWVAAGLLLGFTISIRIDAVLYGIPALGLAWFWRPWRLRDWVGATAAVLLGALPLLAYNAVATGNPLRPTQAMEVERVLSSSSMPALDEAVGAVAETITSWVGPGEAQAEDGALTLREQRERMLLQGGGLRLANFGHTLPLNLQMYLAVFGPLGAALVVLGAVSALRRPPIFLLAVPYVIVATLFFSLWPRPDPRYLAGAILLCSLLAAEGGRGFVEVSRALGRRLGGRLAHAALACVAIGVVVWVAGRPDFAEVSARPYVTVILAGTLAIALLYGALVDAGSGSTSVWRRPSFVFSLVLALGLAGVVASRTASNFERRGSFQKAEVELARQTLESAVGDQAVIFTTTDIGRPAENINFYTQANAVYLREVYRWGAQPGFILDAVEKAGMEAYLLLPPDVARTWIESKYVYPWLAPELVADIPPQEARKWFVASPGHGGVPLWLVRMRRRPVPLEVQ